MDGGWGGNLFHLHFLWWRCYFRCLYILWASSRFFHWRVEFFVRRIHRINVRFVPGTHSLSCHRCVLHCSFAAWWSPYGVIMIHLVESLGTVINCSPDSFTLAVLLEDTHLIPHISTEESIYFTPSAPHAIHSPTTVTGIMRVSVNRFMTACLVSNLLRWGRWITDPWVFNNALGLADNNNN